MNEERKRDEDFTYWTCRECGHETKTVKKAFNYFCGMCNSWHSKEEVKSQQPEGVEL